MKKIRYSLATIVLLAALSGLLPLGTGLASLANATASRHTTASSVAGHSAKPVALLKGPCPVPGADC